MSPINIQKNPNVGGIRSMHVCLTYEFSDFVGSCRPSLLIISSFFIFLFLLSIFLGWIEFVSKFVLVLYRWGTARHWPQTSRPISARRGGSLSSSCCSPSPWQPSPSRFNGGAALMTLFPVYMWMVASFLGPEGGGALPRSRRLPTVRRFSAKAPGRQLFHTFAGGALILSVTMLISHPRSSEQYSSLSFFLGFHFHLVRNGFWVSERNDIGVGLTDSYG